MEEKNRYTLKKDHLDELRKPQGESFESVKGLLKKIKRPLIVVGDRASYNILKQEVNPDLIIHDLKERRKEIDQEMFDTIYGFVAPEIIVENQSGTISNDLWEAIELTLKKLPHRIRVIGEEDLAVLAVCKLAPIGSSIVYGLENKIILMQVTPGKKKLVEKLLEN